MTVFDERMQLLRARFVAQSLGERSTLEGALASRDHETAARILHSLAGNAGMFGFPGLSAASRELEEALAAEAEGAEMTTRRERVRAELHRLEDALAEVPE